MANIDPETWQKLPSVDSLLTDTQIQQAGVGLPRRLVVEAARQAVEHARQSLRDGKLDEISESSLREQVIATTLAQIADQSRPYYRRVVNATGIILHTALGRAVLARRAIDQIEREFSGYSLLQMDMETGRRNRRDEAVVRLLQLLTGTEDAVVVNNNAAATAIALNTVAAGKEVIVSRGQLVEIGGSFRLPEVMAASGVKLVEVGTTNKTHLRDYVNAVTPNTAAIMRVHPSNYKIVGFTAEVALPELVELAHARGLVMIDDVGAGALIDFSRFGFEYEPTLADSIQAGADLVTCSADKLIGAGQGGIILGKKSLIDAIRKNPIARIVRIDKLSLAALEATLTCFLDEALALREIPTLAMLRRPIAEISQAGARLAEKLKPINGLAVEIIDGFSQMGSGSLPGQNLPTRLVAVRSMRFTPDELARRLRLSAIPVIARIHDDRVLIDPRTLLADDADIVVLAMTELHKTEP